LAGDAALFVAIIQSCLQRFAEQQSFTEQRVSDSSGHPPATAAHQLQITAGSDEMVRKQSKLLICMHSTTSLVAVADNVPGTGCN
jgi:hypothetical protein